MLNSKKRRLIAYCTFALALILIATFIASNIQPAHAITATPSASCPVARCIDVSITDTGYSPNQVTIITDRVTMVRWKNNGTMNHTVTFSTCTNCGQTLPASGVLAPGQSFSLTFQTGLMGGGSYHCDFHSSMTGSVNLIEPTPTLQPPTITPTSTITNTPSMVCPKLGLKVQPVMSPTWMSSQVIHASITTGGIPKFTVVAKNSAGTVLSTTNGPNTSSTAQDITIPLQMMTTHYLTVSVNAEVSCTNGQGTPTALTFITESTTVDVNGNPLTIIQTDVTPTPTPPICPTGTPTYVNVLVDPVTSPTSATSQVVSVTTSYPSTVTVSTASGTFTATLGTDGIYRATVTLLANTTHNLTVTAVPLARTPTPVGTPAPACPSYGPVQRTVTTDRNGNPLTIVQQTASNDGSPYGGTARVIPGTVQVEDYNTGGESVAYHDTTAGNAGGAYRTENVDIQTTADAGGGYNVGWVVAGEWTKYTVNVTTAGTYTIDFRVASTNSTGKFRLEVDNANVTGSLLVPNTGAWQTYATVSKAGVNLTAGQHVLKLYTEATSVNYNWIKFTNTSLVPTNTMTAPMTISGRVTLNGINGPGVAGVTILHAFAAYPLQAVATTDANGYYTFTKETMGNTEANTVQPQLAGYTFSPANATFTNYGAGSFTANFVALNGTPTATNTTCGCFGATQTAAAGWTLTAQAKTKTPTPTPTTPSSIAAWAPGVAYTVGTQVTYGGHVYKCIQAHTSQVGWEPPNVPALWGLVS